MILWSVIWHYASAVGIDQVVADTKESAIERVIEKHGISFGKNAYVYAHSGEVTFELARNYLKKKF